MIPVLQVGDVVWIPHHRHPKVWLVVRIMTRQEFDEPVVFLQPKLANGFSVNDGQDWSIISNKGVTRIQRNGRTWTKENGWTT